MNDNPKRAVPRRALSREQISKLSAEELSSRLTDTERATVIAMTRMSFDKKPPAKLETESVGQYRARCREAAEVDEEEFSRALRAGAESAVYDSAAQKQLRMGDTLASTLTPESQAAAEKREAEFQARQKQMARDSDITSVPYPAGMTSEWEGKDKGK